MFSGDALLPFSRHSDVLAGPTPTDEPSLVRLVEELKRRGNAAFQQKSFEEAEALYSRAIGVNDSDPLHNQHIFFANRSASRCSMGKASQALEDAEACVALDATYAKGYFRQAQALSSLKRYKEALSVLDHAKTLEPANKSVLTLYTKVEGLAKQAKAAPAAPVAAKTVTRVDVVKESVPVAAAKPAASASATKVVEDDDDLGGHVRGYKKLADGRVTTFFNNELTDEAKQLIGDIAPKKVENVENVQIKSVEGGSAWNQGNTFEEKDMTAWAKGRLEALLANVTATVDAGMVSSSAVSGLSGDASIAVVRGAKRYIFDFNFSLKCSLQPLAAGESAVEGELKFLDLSSDSGDDYDVEALVATRYSSAAGKALHATLSSSGSPFRRAVAARIAEFVKEYHTF